MPHFGDTSERNLGQCDIVLQGILRDVINFFDFSVITGHRTEEEQQKKVKEGLSQVEWPDSKHNSLPSRAVDVAPYDSRFGALFGNEKQIRAISRWLKENGSKADKEEREQQARQFVRDQYTLLAGVILIEAQNRNVPLRWGGDWNRNWDTLDNRFDDLGHFELV